MKSQTQVASLLLYRHIESFQSLQHEGLRGCFLMGREDSVLVEL
jgi:hypothetical protein